MERPQPLENPLFCFEKDLIGDRIYRLAGGYGGLCSVAAPGREGANEDSVALIPLNSREAVLVIADGVGGHRLGSQASRLAIEEIHRSLKKYLDKKQGLRESILDGFENANRRVLELSGGAATTLSVVRIRDNTIRPYHVGDSLILAVGQRGKIKFQSVSHSPVGYAVEAGFLEEAEAMHHEERHLVFNFVGSPDMSIEIGSEVKLGSRDTLLLASDGLSDNLETGEIVHLIRKGELTRVIQQVYAQARKRMLEPVSGIPHKPDDMTFILFRLVSAVTPRRKS